MALRALLEPGAADPEQPPIRCKWWFSMMATAVWVWWWTRFWMSTEEAVTVRQKSSRKGLLGSAVVGKQVTDFLDLNEVITGDRESWFEGGGGIGRAKDPGRRRLGLLARPDPQCSGHGRYECSRPPIWTKRLRRWSSSRWMSCWRRWIFRPAVFCSLATMREEPEWQRDSGGGAG